MMIFVIVENLIVQKSIVIVIEEEKYVEINVIVQIVIIVQKIQNSLIKVTKDNY